MLSLLVVFVLGTAATGFVARNFIAPARSLVWLSFGAHLVAASSQVWITTSVYGSGDMTMYHELGGYVARWIEVDPSSAWPETIRLLLRDEAAWFPFDVIRPGDPTGAMVAFSGVLEVLVGDSLLAKCLVVALVSFVAKAAAALSMSRWLPHLQQRVVVGAICLVPSVVYWTCGLLKEAVAVSGACFTLVAVDIWLRGRRITALPMGLLGTALVSMSKPFLFLPLTAGLSASVYFRSGRGVALRASSIALGASVAVGGVVLVGQIFPMYAFESALQHAAYLQEVGATVDGGSNYSLGGGEGSLVGQLSVAPLGALSALFRPLPFEVRNAVMAISAMETSLLLVWTWRSLATTDFGRLRQWTMGSGVAMGMLAFVLVCAVAVGISSTNLGTLSRYRVPLVPFAFLLTLAWREIRRRPVGFPIPSE